MASDSSSTATATVNTTAINALPCDVISTHILTKLDGQTLASTACASPLLHTLCTEEKLWRDICNSTWTSISDPRVREIIPTFPAGYRSFFSDSFPTLHHGSQTNHNRRSTITELISAVDIKYQNTNVFSKLEVTNTGTHSFLCSPFWVELLDSKSPVTTPAKFYGPGDDTILSELENHTTLSWIVIDPTRKRAANLSSIRPVLADRSGVSGEVKLIYATVMAGDWSEHVEWKMEVTCGVKGGGELIVKEVNMEVVDLDGRILSGEDSLVILEEGMESGERKLGEERERYMEFMEIGRERRGRVVRRQKEMDFEDKIWVGFFVILFLLFLWSLWGE
ncbi:hypothetical protein LguiB_026039 [Lonicera macranthoides]